MLRNFHVDLFLHWLFLDCLIVFISSKLTPEFLECRIIIHIFFIIRPFQLILIFSIFNYTLPIFLIHHLLHFFNVLIGVLKCVNSLKIVHGDTSALSWAISTSAIFSLRSLVRTSAFSTNFSMSFFALRRGMSFFLFFVFS